MSASGSLEHPSRSELGRILAFPADRAADVVVHLGLVDGLLREALGDLTHLWRSQLADAGLDGDASDLLSSHDLPELLSDLAATGGKRLRPLMAYLGWVAASGRGRGVGHADVVRVGAALELLHLFGLIHDDVMDESDSRRGRPTVHVRAGEFHASAPGRGCSQRFGESIAILLGDLAHAEADNLAGQLPEPMRRIWRVLVVELVCGQRYDLTGSASGRHDLPHARHVARSKSGAYTVERPLQLGAAAAAAPEVVIASLRTYGRELGEAFALRDDVLGVWGDPERTGKPVGDDLMAGKPTVLMALAWDRLTGSSAALLRRVTEGKAESDEVEILLSDLEAAGLRSEVEDLIAGHVRTALAALDDRVLDEEGITQLRRMAAEIAWRDK